jgi:tRNA G18 (ribose-2'-O)-methylase SpoU
MTDEHEVGVGPHPLPWPDDARLDPELLDGGDRRNVLDEYRYWTREAIVADLDLKRHRYHVAIENFQHDFNIGTIVRNANAFLVHTVHIVGKRRWNRRGAMVTDRYQHIEYHASVGDFVQWAFEADLPLVGVDICKGSQPIETFPLPERCVLVLGQEGPGLSADMVEACGDVVHISQYGSTRSINVGVASGIAMHSWLLQHVG